jgi:hypothetical protein
VIVARMLWLLTLTALGLFVWSRRGTNQERAASGMLASPMYLAASGLSVLLIVVTLYMATLKDQLSAYWFIVVAVMVAAILIIRRALKWRYPYR